ncbi:MAG: hypothetical protein ISS16_00990 [Ignavibacteria bacterium]|nr:hypothetical protein [Ignavibacteria bacterium]
MSFNFFDIILIYILFLFGLLFIFLAKAFKDCRTVRIYKKIGAFLFLFSCTCFILGFIQSYTVAIKEDNLNLQDFISLESKDSFESQLDSLFISSDSGTMFDMNKTFREVKRIGE